MPQGTDKLSSAKLTAPLADIAVTEANMGGKFIFNLRLGSVTKSAIQLRLGSSLLFLELRSSRIGIGKISESVKGRVLSQLLRILFWIYRRFYLLGIDKKPLLSSQKQYM